MAQQYFDMYKKNIKRNLVFFFLLLKVGTVSTKLINLQH